MFRNAIRAARASLYTAESAIVLDVPVLAPHCSDTVQKIIWVVLPFDLRQLFIIATIKHLFLVGLSEVGLV